MKAAAAEVGEQLPFVLRMIQERKSLILATRFCSVAFESYVHEPIGLQAVSRKTVVDLFVVWLTTMDAPRRTKFAHLWLQHQGGFENAL